MEKSRSMPEDASGHFQALSDRYDKGSAMDVIRNEAERTREKTARLRALRMARQAAEPRAAAKARPAASKATRNA